MLSHLAKRGIVTRNICGVWVEDERAFRRHTVHPNLCHFLESILNRLSLNLNFCLSFLSLLNIHVLPSAYTFLHDCLAHIHWHHCPLVLIPCQHALLEIWAFSNTACSGRLALQRLLAKLYLSQELGCYKASSALSLQSFFQLAHSENAAEAGICFADCFQYLVLLKVWELWGKVS